MAKRVHNFGMTPLDREVAAMVGRIGTTGQPESHIAAYSVEREASGPYFVTVRFVADDGFDARGRIQPPGASEALIAAGWLPPDRVAALREMAGEATGCGVEYETLQNRIMAQLPGPHGFGCECDEAGTDPRCAMKAVQP